MSETMIKMRTQVQPIPFLKLRNQPPPNQSKPKVTQATTPVAAESFHELFQRCLEQLE